MKDLRITELSKLMCQWNAKKWEHREGLLLLEIWELFQKECLEKWNELYFKPKIRKEMVK